MCSFGLPALRLIDGLAIGFGLTIPALDRLSPPDAIEFQAQAGRHSSQIDGTSLGMFERI